MDDYISDRPRIDQNSQRDRTLSSFHASSGPSAMAESSLTIPDVGGRSNIGVGELPSELDRSETVRRSSSSAPFLDDEVCFLRSSRLEPVILLWG